MKYLKEFETSALLEDFKLTDNYETPSVYMLSDTTLEFNKYHDYSQDYLTLVALEDCEFSFKFLGTTDYGGYYVTPEMWERIAYSLDNGETWTELVNPGNLANTGLTTPTIHKGEKVIWKGIGTKNYKSGPVGAQYGNHCYFSSTGRYNVEGNILSLAYSDNFKNQESLAGTDHIFSAIFADSNNLISAKNLALSATTLGQYCYYCMFASCSSLISCPSLPATTLAEYCYSHMFRYCSSLIKLSSILPATTLADNCYNYMYLHCTGLTTVPSDLLPATTLAINCYGGMFSECSSLITIPELSATTLTSNCYDGMFSSCTSLTTVPELPATSLVQSCYYAMFRGCTSLTSVPSDLLPATTLAKYCYYGMFSGCSSLTTAPELPATSFAESCYNEMFKGTNVLPDTSNIDFTSSSVIATKVCKGLFAGTKVTDSDLMNILPINPDTNQYWLPVTTLSQECYMSMFYGCTLLTTAPELPATTLANSCYSIMFTDCTLLNSITCLARSGFNTNWSTNPTNRWVDGVAASGTFTKSNGVSSWTIDESGIPSGWTVINV